MAFLKILFYLIVLIVVLMLAYYTTRMLGRGMGRKILLSADNSKIICRAG